MRILNLKYILCYYLLTVALISCAQSKSVLKNIYATYREVLPGNIAVDINGKEIAARDTINFVYVETSSTEIKWKMAWKNNKAFSIEASLIETNPFDAGIDKVKSEKILIRVAPGNKLWQLRLMPVEENIPAPKTLSHDIILIQYSNNGKIMWQKI
ncbi:MAG: hypothetical protein ABIY62_10320, partial [Ginsengibacter sp.]